jgi:TolA-binding protein
MARIKSQNQSASMGQSNDDTSDSERTVKASAPHSRRELEDQIRKLKKENAELRTANEELGEKNEKLEEENQQWIHMFKDVSDELEVKNQLRSSTETPSGTDLGSAVPGGDQATSSSPLPTHTSDGRRITSRLRQFMSEGKGKRL